MIRGIRLTSWFNLALRRTHTLTIGLLLVLTPVCESLASVHNTGTLEHDHEPYSGQAQIRAFAPCHDIQGAPLSSQSNDAPSLSFEFDETLTDYSTIVSNPPTNRHRTLFSRNEQWSSDPSVHLANCVFLN